MSDRALDVYFLDFGPVDDLVVTARISPQLLLDKHDGLSSVLKAYSVLKKNISVLNQLLHCLNAFH